MSRIGKRILKLSDAVTVTEENRVLTVKGPKGELTLKLVEDVKVLVEGNELRVESSSSALHGTFNALVKNMIEGVTNGYTKDLEIVGVGYRFTLSGNKLTVNAGYSNPVVVEIPEGITAEVPSNTELKLSCINKEKLGEFAANIRKIRKPEPYKGKGIRYKTEHVRRKEGKKVA